MINGDGSGGASERADPGTEEAISDLETAAEYDASIGMGLANVIGIGVLPIIGCFVFIPFTALWGIAPIRAAFRDIASVAVFIPSFLAAIVAHEGLHALAFRFAGGAEWTSIRFGMNWKALAPYAHCRSAMSARAYRIAVSLPGLVLGSVPAAIAIATGDGWLAVWGFVMIAAAGGDIAILLAIRKVPGRRMVRDHPARAGCEVLREVTPGGS